MAHRLLLAWLITVVSGVAAGLSSVPHEARVDCWPETNGANKLACLARGCNWRDDSETVNDDSEPVCYYPPDYPAYRLVQGARAVGYGAASLSFQRDAGPLGWPPSRLYDRVSLTVSAHSDRVARIKIADRPDTSRWQVPLPLFGGGKSATGAAAQQFSVETSSSPDEQFFVRVTRKLDGWPLFETGSSNSTFGPLLFADQFLQLSIGLSAEVVYGLGEHTDLGPFAKPLNKWQRIVLWNQYAETTPNKNLRGSHNFLLAVGQGGRAFGIFLLNSNAQEVVLQPRLGDRATVTYRSIGGILDFFVFVGPTPKDVIQQYHELLGPPMMPPFWSLGFHMSRCRFGSLSRLKFIYERNVNISIPIDVMWADVDRMDEKMDFGGCSLTLDWSVEKDSYGGLDNFIKQLHDQHRAFVVNVNPGIKNNAKGYLAYDLGLQMNVFMRTADNMSYMEGLLYPVKVLWPDFTHPNATAYWQRSSSQFLSKYPVDGLWIDMNEPKDDNYGLGKGCPVGDPLDHPPYMPPVPFSTVLFRETVCPSAQQYLSSHYNLHNMYAYHEAEATWQVLRTRPDGQKDNQQRQFVLSRSTFPGIQSFAFHSTGHYIADWHSLRYSLTYILNFNLFGIVNTGVNICGFNFYMTEELCIRWTQLGAFFPFMRYHTYLSDNDHDPAAFSPRTQDILREQIKLRYALLPYMYTQFYLATANGSTVARSLMEEFPSDEVARLIDDQFLMGPAIMVCPVTVKGDVDRQVYFPSEPRWFSRSSEEVTAKGFQKVPAPLDYIPIYLRGGHIIPSQTPGNDTYHQRLLQPFILTVYPDHQGNAEGFLFWDRNGVDDLSLGRYQLIHFSASNGSLSSRHLHQFPIGVQMQLSQIQVIGVPAKPSSVTVNGSERRFYYHNKVLWIYPAGVDLKSPLTASWK